MKVLVKANEKMTFEFEADQTKDIFENIAHIQEVFGNLTFTSKDGKYTTDNVRLNVRTDDDDNKYYEAVVMEPGPYMYAKKKYGVNKKGGGLFPKKEEGHRSYWVKYNKDTQKEEEV